MHLITNALVLLPTIDNPLDGILPDFTIFGVEFTQLWQQILAGLWGLAILVNIGFVVVGVVNMGSASTAGNPGAYKDARTQAMWALIALGALAALSVIVGAILAFFG